MRQGSDGIFHPGDRLELAAKALHELAGDPFTHVLGDRSRQETFGPRQDVLEAASGKSVEGPSMVMSSARASQAKCSESTRTPSQSKMRRVMDVWYSARRRLRFRWGCD